MRKRIVAGNWKMNKDYQGGIELVSEALNMINDELTTEVTTIFASPFIHLKSIAQLAKGYKNIYIGAQNCHQERSGAYTGEISAEMIRSTGAEYVLIGHSERRIYFQENNELLASKVKVALAAGLTPIFCIGETLDERNASEQEQVVYTQLKESLFHLPENDITRLVIAYEPVWAIGTGLTASPEQAQEMHAYIRSVFATAYSSATADSLSILYGGSCNPQNAHSLFSQKDIDGGLIGGASLKSRDFTTIVTTFNSIR